MQDQFNAVQKNTPMLDHIPQWAFILSLLFKKNNNKNDIKQYHSRIILPELEEYVFKFIHSILTEKN